ncbi:hypothetical protein COY17_03510 [Candidatus Saccharibacteria bacterium CG_4_10_14_0_2_um_filter_52_9]|nr:MAG: hypothetical protein COY17_03510 [Candidatus Saccharibacteria bacterium CG_4_10_14_0_2_um_filter_52_9]
MPIFYVGYLMEMAVFMGIWIRVGVQVSCFTYLSPLQASVLLIFYACLIVVSLAIWVKDPYAIQLEV